MIHWRTTTFAILAAVGEILHNADAVPVWVNLAGKCCSAAGLVGMGYSASDKSVTNAAAVTQQEKDETKT